MTIVMTPEQVAEWTPARRVEIASRFPANWTLIQQLIEEATQPAAISTAQRIVDLCAECAGVSVKELISPRRRNDIATVRMAAAYLIDRECESFSLSMVGRKLGNRDHSTIYMAKKRVAEDLASGGERFGAIIAYVSARLALR